MAKHKEEKTNVMRTLEQKKIPYTAYTYPHEEGVPVDGVVVAGAASVDESAITGESVPVDKAPGDPVTGATVSRTGYFLSLIHI